MSVIRKKYRIEQKLENGNLKVLLPETTADVVEYDNTTSGLTATNIQDAIDEITQNGVSTGSSVTGVKGSEESTYRTGNVSISAANVGAAAASHTHGNITNAGAIGSDSGKVITTTTDGVLQAENENTAFNKNFETLTTNIKANGSVSVGTASTVARADHVHPTDTTRLSVTPDGTNALISNNKINTTYIPDVLLGQVLYGGTVTGAGVATLSINAKTRLNTSSTSITLTNDTTATTGYAANDGIFYIASSAGTFAGLSIAVGDWLISTGSKWEKIDNTDAVTSVNGNIGSVVLSGTDIKRTANDTDNIDTDLTAIETNISNIVSGTTGVGVAEKLGTSSSSLTTAGSATQPVYINSGVPTAGSAYAGGTAVTLNGTDKSASTATLYAPTTSGTTDQVLTATTDGAPVWANQNSIAAGTAAAFASAQSVTLTGDVTGTASSTAGWSVATTLSNSGISAGTYSVLSINAKGIATAGAQLIEVGTTKNGSPSASLAVGGLYFELLDDE